MYNIFVTKKLLVTFFRSVVFNDPLVRLVKFSCYLYLLSLTYPYYREFFNVLVPNKYFNTLF